MEQDVLPHEWSLLAPDEFTGDIGGDGLVFGTAGGQFVSVLSQAGTVQLDPSFNQGSADVVQLSGAALGWTASVSGSNAVLANLVTTVVVPIGLDGLTLSFEDGTRTLRYDPQSQTVLLGDQTITTSASPIIATVEGEPVEMVLVGDAVGRLLLDVDGSVTLGGSYEIFGTAGDEHVELLYGTASFDASFNRGGDEVILAGDASSFDVFVEGSSVVFVNEVLDVLLPVGLEGLELEFDDGVRTVRYDDFIEEVIVGAQTVLVDAAALGSAPDAVRDIVLFWNDAALEAIATASTAPPAAARALAIQGIAVLDAIASIGASDAYLVEISASGPVDLNALVSYASWTALKELIPSQADLFDARLAEIMPELGGGEAFANAMAIGIAAAEGALAARANDGSGASVTYEYGDQPGDWVATPPAFAQPALPHWSGVNPFALDSAEQFRVDAPPALDSAEYAEALDEVRRLGSLTDSERTEDQSQIAVFWEDGAGTYTPPGHWNAIAAEISEAEGQSTAENALTFAMLNVAMADAGIAAWDSKYTYQFWRPLTAIRSADLDGNDETSPDFGWEPYLTTPNHPTYVSGHSTFSGAAAEVMNAIFGDDYAFETGGVGVPDVLRSFANFDEAAMEGGLSRIYGGIHYSFDNFAGLDLGEDVGNWAVQSFIAAGATGGVALMG